MSGTPPNDVNAERALLGAVLLEPSTLDELGGLLLADDFYAPSNATVWAAFEALSAKGQPIDHVNLRGYLAERGEVERAGGEEALLKLGEPSLGIIHPEKHAERLSVLAQRRRVLEACQRGMVSGYDTTIDHAEYIQATEAAVFNAAQDLRNRSRLTHVRSVVQDVVKSAGDAAKHNGVTGLRTGIGGLDRLLTGLHPGELHVLGGRPGMGKSGLAARVVLQAAGVDKRTCLVFSLEMPRDQWVMRLICQEGRVSTHALRGGKMTPLDWQSFASASNAVASWPVHIDDSPGLTISQLRAVARRTKAREDLGLIIVDSLQLMRGLGTSREQVVSEIARSLKEVAKELDVPVLALSALNREAQKRSDKRPGLADLRESGEIEQSADTVWLVHRPVHDQSASQTEAEVIIDKQRNGPCDTIPLFFDAKSARFDQGNYGGYGDDQS